MKSVGKGQGWGRDAGFACYWGRIREHVPCVKPPTSQPCQSGCIVSVHPGAHCLVGLRMLSRGHDECGILRRAMRAFSFLAHEARGHVGLNTGLAAVPSL